MRPTRGRPDTVRTGGFDERGGLPRRRSYSAGATDGAGLFNDRTASGRTRRSPTPDCPYRRRIRRGFDDVPMACVRQADAHHRRGAHL